MGLFKLYCQKAYSSLMFIFGFWLTFSKCHKQSLLYELLSLDSHLHISNSMSQNVIVLVNLVLATAGVFHAQTWFNALYFLS
jgi:fumarate reductase subunit C